MSFNHSPFHDIDVFVESEIRKNPDDFLLSEDVVDAMRAGGVESREIEQIVGAPEVRVGDAARKLLTSDATERAARLARIVSLAQKVFGSDQKAFLWLRAPHAQLASKTPIECVKRETGARFVEDILVRIDHGIAA